MVQQSISASGDSSLPLFLPHLKAALHPPSPSLSFPLIPRHLPKPDEAKTGITSHFHNFPCSDVLFHLSISAQTAAKVHFPQRALANGGMAPSFFHQSIVHSSIK